MCKKNAQSFDMEEGFGVGFQLFYLLVNVNLVKLLNV
jgi:hypothetical protein